MNTAIIGLGSNINAEVNILKAKAILAQDYEVINESRFGKTKPIGPSLQPDFINGALLLKTELNYQQLRRQLKYIEAALGRTETMEKCGPGPIDLDIIVWNNKIIHRDFYERSFIRDTVLELLPDLKTEAW